MQPPFFIRTAMIGDIPVIRKLLVETWHDTYDQTIGSMRVEELTIKWHGEEQIRKRLDQPNTEFLVADSGEEIGGVAFASSSSKRIYLHQLYVHPQFQGRNIGRQMLEELEGCFPDCNRISLEVEAVNEKAIAFYVAQGFAITGKSAHCMEEGSNIPVVTMEKPVIFVN